MCGLAGCVSADPAEPGDGARAAAMIAALAHRGPDGEGLRTLPGCALAHRRLAIIDLSPRAAQPMSNEDETIWIVFNGEIYNHVELRRDLERRHRFRSASDTEVILHLYEERGAEAVRPLRGLFAFAIWDGRRQRLMLARDRIGKKPLHYRLDPHGIEFASEIPALLAGGGGRELDPAALGTYLCLGYVPAPATAIRGIRRLPAGSILTYERGSAEVARYWSPPLPDTSEREEPVSSDALRRTFMPLLEESVRLRLRSDVPVGLFLSGGLDSSVVAAVAARCSGEPLKSFTVVFEETGYDESRPARETAAALGTDHHEIRVRACAAEVLPALIRRMGEPFADSSLVAVHHLSEAVGEDVKVVLSGDGGDEVFLGYDRYRAHRLAERWRRLPVLARGAAEAAVAALPGPRGRRNLAGRARRFVEAAARDPLASNDRWLCRFLPSELPELLTDEALAALPANPLEPLHHLYAEASSVPPLDAIARADLALWLPEDVLRKMDAASMGSGIEVRSPLLDQEIVEAAGRLPAAVKMRRARGKEILRLCAERILPRPLLSRRKAGFGLPVDRWLRSGPLRDLARDLLLSPAARARGLIRAEAARRLLDEHESGEANHDEAIWTLMVLEIFFKEVMEATP